MVNTVRTSLPGFIDPSDHSHPELHGFEVSMSGEIIVPEFHPCPLEQIVALIDFESELCTAIDAAA